MNDMTIGPHDIHLWFAFPDEIMDTLLLSSYRQLLSPDERNKQQRFYFSEHRHQYLVAHALVRTTLSRYAAVHPRDLEFVCNDYGKPEVVVRGMVSPLRFNLSHTDGLIACAVILENDIGVDVEKVHRAGIDLAHADRFFSPKEMAEFQPVPEERKRERFFEYWTLKESYIKARGMGLSIPLDRFSFHISDHEALNISFHPKLDDDPDRWQFMLMAPTPHYRAALSVGSCERSGFQFLIQKVVPLRSENAFFCPIINQSEVSLSSRSSRVRCVL